MRVSRLERPLLWRFFLGQARPHYKFQAPRTPLGRLSGEGVSVTGWLCLLAGGAHLAHGPEPCRVSLSHAQHPARRLVHRKCYRYC